MQRAFLLNIGFLVLANLLIKPFYIFGIDRTVQNTVPTADYGLYFTLFNFTFLFQIINDFGLQNFNNQHLSRHRQLLAKYFPSFLSLKLLLGVLYLLLVWAGAKLAGYPAGYFPLLMIVGCNWILLSLVLFLRSNVSGLGWYRTDSLLSVLDRSLMIVVCGLLLWTPAWSAGFRIEWFVYAQTGTLFLTALTAWLILRGEIGRWRFRFRPVYLLMILKKSYPYALVIFLMTVYTRIDGVMLERMLPDGTRQAGWYAMAYRLLDAAGMFGFLVAGLLLPMFARLLRERRSVRPLLRMSFRIVWVASVTLAVAVYFFRIPIMRGLYLEGDVYTGNILGWLILSFIAISGTYVHGTLLTANGSLRYMNLIFAAGVVVNIALNWWLIPRMQAAGAAMATFITQSLVWLAQLLLVYRVFPWPWSWRSVLRFAGFGAACVLLFWPLANWSGWSLSWLYRFALCFVLGAGMALVFGLVRPGALLELARGRDNFEDY